MQQQVLESIAAVELAVHVVWAPIMRADDFDAATRSRELISDPRSLHYWDADKSLAEDYVPMLDLPEDNGTLAWDIYFVFEPGVKWEDGLPTPSAWWHQLGFDDRQLRDGSSLRDALRESSSASAQETTGASP